MVKRIVLLWAIIQFTTSMSIAQLNEIQFEDVDSLMKIEPRPIMVWIHTDWCRYCEQMRNTTFKNENLVDRLSEQFYFLSLNAEDTRDINFKNHVFKFVPTGPNTGMHDLARQLGTVDGGVTFPTTTILNSAYEIIYQHNEYLSSKEFLKLIKQVSERKD